MKLCETCETNPVRDGDDICDACATCYHCSQAIEGPVAWDGERGGTAYHPVCYATAKRNNAVLDDPWHCTACGKQTRAGDVKVLADSTGRGEIASDVYHWACYLVAADIALPSNSLT